MSREEKIRHFNPNGAGNTDGSIFGLPFTVDEAEVVILPVPWDVTVSYGAGTADGPEAVCAASPQLDLYDEDLGSIWKRGIAMLPVDAGLRARSEQLRALAEPIIRMNEEGRPVADDPQASANLQSINAACAAMCDWVEEQGARLLQQGKKVVLLGGDHSTPLGLFRALARQHGEFGILQVDAHMDLRQAYEGFRYSHASIMYNALQEVAGLRKLVQVGLRDMCEEEIERAADWSDRVACFTDRKLQRQLLQGKSWADICQQIVAELPPRVYFSFDIDGLEPSLCPNTGTPVPGGLGFEQALYLLDAVRASGRTIIGADLVEVNPGTDGSEWDGNVGARLLYRMCGLVS